LGEGLCTFLFLFAVQAAAINNLRQDMPENLALNVVTTGWISIALIYSFADVSGAHFNPGITFGLMVSGNIRLTKGLCYLAIQLIMGIFATLACAAIFPMNLSAVSEKLLVTFGDDADVARAFFMEFFLQFFLVYVVHATAVVNILYSFLRILFQ
jgi:glycerol uptake facilitator-like aquaporin